MIRYLIVLLITTLMSGYAGFGKANYHGSQAYNYASGSSASVNVATGSFRFSYPLVNMAGVHEPFTINLTYHFNASGNFGLPKGWRFDLDHVDQRTVHLAGQQWLIDPLWHDNTFFASGLKYYNQHGNSFHYEGEAQKIPVNNSAFYARHRAVKEPADYLYYRYKSMHKDGSVKYFSQQGLLVLQKDRFGNQITIEYEQPATSAKDARLAAMVDNYGNRYTFNYEPGVIIVRFPDGRTQQVYIKPQGISSIINPLGQHYEFTYIQRNGYELLRTLQSPSGLMTELSYGTIPFIDADGNGSLPVVTRLKKVDLASNNIHHETYYHFSQDNNYTGYPLYAMSRSGDSLIDSNDQNYRYVVEVEQVDNSSAEPLLHHKTYTYNFLHLPVEIRTMKNGRNFLKTHYNYAISPFKYNRSTNYDKPLSIVHATWHEASGQFIPSNRTDHAYDLFGNRTLLSHWVYHRTENRWRQLRKVDYEYFTQHYSLLYAITDQDLTSGQTVKKKYQLSSTRKNHSAKMIYGNNKASLWLPWKQINYCYDDLGRKTLTQLKWLAKGRPGVQKTFKKTHYHFDPHSKVLTTRHESSLGNITQALVDTRNQQLLAHITALGERTEYRYNALGQRIEQQDPQGNVHKFAHYTYASDGLNATVSETPLGFKRRRQRDASGRIIREEALVNNQYQTLSAKEYNGFDKIIRLTNRFGFLTSYQYDDQMRLTERRDPWNNKTRIVYDDDNMTQNTFVNGHKQKIVKRVPWLLQTHTISYPMTHAVDAVAVEKRMTRNSLGQVIKAESALLDTQFSKRHAVIANTYHYDLSRNKINIATQGDGGLSLTKEQTYDLFNNLYTFTKHQNDNGRTNTHQGYRYVYNSDNQLARVFTASPQRLVTLHRYDKNGREIQRELADGRIIENQYNANGLLQLSRWQRRGKPYQKTHDYDADNRLIRLCDSENQQQHYQYDPRGLLTAVTYPDNHQQTYEYDHSGRLVRQKNVGNRVITYRFDKNDRGNLSAINNDRHEIRFTYGVDDNGINGRLLKIQRTIDGAGTTEEKQAYDAYGRLARSEITANQSPVLSRAYRYLPRGEIIQHTKKTYRDQQPITATTTYHYDALKRLTKETQQQVSAAGAHTREIRYQYDGNNNLINEQRHATGAAAQTIQRHYDSRDQLINITENGVDSAISHDSNGRIVNDHLGNTYQYDDVGLLMSARDAKNNRVVAFDYRPDGLLSRVSSDRGGQHFYYDRNLRVQTVFKDRQWHDFIQQGNQFLGTLTGASGEHVFVSNQSSGARLRMNKNGKQSSSVYFYEGYGQSENAGDDTDSPCTDFLWNQEFKDKTTGVVYLRHRFYHPQLRRFMTRDEAKVDNRYVYARANPIDFIDPMGRSAQYASYVGGFVFALLSIIGGLLFIPTEGASLSLSYIGSALGVASGVTGTVAGTSLIASQLLMDYGNPNIGKGLEYFGYAIGALAGIEVIAATAIKASIKLSSVLATTVETELTTERLTGEVVESSSDLTTPVNSSKVKMVRGKAFSTISQSNRLLLNQFVASGEHEPVDVYSQTINSEVKISSIDTSDTSSLDEPDMNVIANNHPALTMAVMRTNEYNELTTITATQPFSEHMNGQSSISNVISWDSGALPHNFNFPQSSGINSEGLARSMFSDHSIVNQ